MSANATRTNSPSYSLGRLWNVKVLSFQVAKGLRAVTADLPYLSRSNGHNELILLTLLKGHSDIPIFTTIINVEYHNKSYFFQVSYRFNTIFTRNRALMRLYRGTVWLGDLVVIRLGNQSEFINIHGGDDRRAAERAVYEFLREVNPRLDEAAASYSHNHINFPEEIYVPATATASIKA